MTLEKKDLEMLKKSYPQEYYTIKEENGKLVVTPKKTVVRVFKKQLAQFRRSSMLEGEDFGACVLSLIDRVQLQPNIFEQMQVTVDKSVADRLSKEAKKCHTRKIIYLQKLLGER